jgi:hypothetical protein
MKEVLQTKSLNKRCHSFSDEPQFKKIRSSQSDPACQIQHWNHRHIYETKQKSISQNIIKSSLSNIEKLVGISVPKDVMFKLISGNGKINFQTDNIDFIVDLLFVGCYLGDYKNNRNVQELGKNILEAWKAQTFPGINNLKALIYNLYIINEVTIKYNKYNKEANEKNYHFEARNILRDFEKLFNSIPKELKTSASELIDFINIFTSIYKNTGMLHSFEGDISKLQQTILELVVNKISSLYADEMTNLIQSLSELKIKPNKDFVKIWEKRFLKIIENSKDQSHGSYKYGVSQEGKYFHPEHYIKILHSISILGLEMSDEFFKKWQEEVISTNHKFGHGSLVNALYSIALLDSEKAKILKEFIADTALRCNHDLNSKGLNSFSNVQLHQLLTFSLKTDCKMIEKHNFDLISKHLKQIKFNDESGKEPNRSEKNFITEVSRELSKYHHYIEEQKYLDRLITTVDGEVFAFRHNQHVTEEYLQYDGPSHYLSCQLEDGSIKVNAEECPKTKLNTYLIKKLYGCEVFRANYKKWQESEESHQEIIKELLSDLGHKNDLKEDKPLQFDDYSLDSKVFDDASFVPTGDIPNLYEFHGLK